MGYSKERKKIREEIELGFLNVTHFRSGGIRKSTIIYMHLYPIK